VQAGVGKDIQLSAELKPLPAVQPVVEAEINARNHRLFRPRQRVARMDRILLGRCSVLIGTQGGGEVR
jgi:hypothetical protein